MSYDKITAPRYTAPQRKIKDIKPLQIELRIGQINHNSVNVISVSVY